MIIGSKPTNKCIKQYLVYNFGDSEAFLVFIIILQHFCLQAHFSRGDTATEPKCCHQCCTAVSRHFELLNCHLIIGFQLKHVL